MRQPSRSMAFNIRWRLLRNLPFLVCHVIAINDEDVILCVHAYTADLSDYPFSRQRLWPVGSDNKFGTAVLCLRRADYSQSSHEAYAKPNPSETPHLFLHFASHFSLHLRAMAETSMWAPKDNLATCTVVREGSGLLKYSL